MSRARFSGLALGAAVLLALSCSTESTLVPFVLPMPASPSATSFLLTSTATATTPQSTDTPAATSTLTPTPTPGPIGPFLPLSLGEGQPEGDLRDWRVSPDGTLWVTTDQALASYNSEGWTIHPTYGDIILGFDAAGSVWVTFDDGASIAVWDGDTWTVYAPQAGWTSAGPVRRLDPHATIGEEIVIDGRGWTWIVTQKDVRALVGDQWTLFSPEGAGFTPSPEMIQAGFDFRLTDVALDSAGDVWVADCAWMGPGPMGRGARRFTGDEWQGEMTDPVSSGCVEDIEVDSYGRIWLGIDDELHRYTPGDGWEAFVPPEIQSEWGQRWGWISDIELGADGTAWVSMSPCGGASCDTGVLILFLVRDGEWTYISDRGPIDLALDDEGDGWLCAGNGLYRIEEGRVQSIHQKEDFYCRVEADSLGKAWLSVLDLPTFWIYDPAGSG